MPKINRNALLLAKIQPTALTDPIPTAPLNAMLASNIKINAIQPAFADRNNIKPYFGNMGKVMISQYSTISFDIELQSAGAAGTAPKFGPLLRACAFAETITASVSAAYAPVTSALEFCALRFYLDGLLFNLTDAKGTFTIDVSAGQIPKMSFTFTGLFALPTDTVVPTGSDFSGFKDPLGINKVNTPTFSLHGTAFKAEKLTLDIANQVIYRNLIGSEAIIISDRKPTGSVSIETESMATKDLFTIIKNGTLGALQVIHGATAGSIVQIDAPKVQFTSHDLADSNGVSMTNMNMELQPNVGNDELVLTFK